IPPAGESQNAAVLRTIENCLSASVRRFALLFEPATRLGHSEVARPLQISKCLGIVAADAVADLVHVSNVGTGHGDSAFAGFPVLSHRQLVILRGARTAPVGVRQLRAAVHPALVAGACEEF